MPRHKSIDYKLTAVQYYLVKNKTQEDVCKIFKCTPRSLMRWIGRKNKAIRRKIKQLEVKFAHIIIL